MTNQKLVRSIVANAFLAAIYFVLTVLCGQFAYGAIQFRISEMLILLCFFRPDFIIGITVGTFLSNLMSSLALDMVFGTLATLLSAVGIAFLSPRLLPSILYPVVINAVVVGLELWMVSGLDAGYFVYCMLTVGGGELAVLVVGYILMMLILRKPAVRESLGFTRHLEVKW